MKDPILAGKTILIAEDEEGIREILAQYFQYLGATILEAKSGNEAFQIFENSSPDLIISDARMPDGDGIAFFRKAKSHRQQLPPFILITGLQDYLGTDQPDGITQVFSKPFKLVELEILVRNALGLPQNSS